jgi:hypothetical protein
MLTAAETSAELSHARLLPWTHCALLLRARDTATSSAARVNRGGGVQVRAEAEGAQQEVAAMQAQVAAREGQIGGLREQLQAAEVAAEKVGRSAHVPCAPRVQCDIMR